MGLLLSGAAHASNHCLDQEQQLLVRVNQEVRGPTLVMLSDQQIALQKGILSGPELIFVGSEIVCDGVTYQWLKPEATPVLNLQNASLDVDLPVRLFPVQTRIAQQLPDPEVVVLTPEPAVTVSYRMQLDKDLQKNTPWRERGNFEVRLNDAQWDARFQVGQSWNGELNFFNPRAQVTYQWDGVKASGLWNSNLPSLSGNLWALPRTDRFSGLAVQGQEGLQRTIPEVELELPRFATVTVSQNNRVLDRFQAGPGLLKLQNIAVTGAEGTLLIRIQDRVKTSTVKVPFKFNGQVNPAGSIQYVGFAGWQEGHWAGGAQAVYGLDENWNLQGQLAGRTDGTAALQVSGVTRRDGQMFSVGLGLEHADQSWSGHLKLATEMTSGPVTWSAALMDPFQNPLRPRVDVEAKLQDDKNPVDLSGSAYWNSLNGNFGVKGSLGYTMNQNRVQIYAQQDSGNGFRIGLTGRFEVDPISTATVQVKADPETRTVQPEVVITQRLDGATQIRYGANPQKVFGAFSIKGPVNGSVQADSTGQFTARFEGSVLMTETRAFVQSQASGTAVLLQTGVPGMSLYLNGDYAGTTDDKGVVWVAGLDPRATNVLSVKLEELPFTVVPKRTSLQIKMQSPGAAQYDWSSNFQVNRWIQFFWQKDEMARFGSVLLADGQEVLLDEEGWGLFPSGTFKGQLRTESGQSCDVEIGTAEQVTCPK